MAEPDDIVRELTEGRGYVILERLFDADTVAEARARILECEGLKGGHEVRSGGGVASDRGGRLGALTSL